MKYSFYCIENLLNGKKYVGLTKRNPDTRFSEHIKNALSEHDLRNDYFMPILNAIRKYGQENFIMKVLDVREFDNFGDAEIYEGQLIVKNDSFLDKNGYNLNYLLEGNRTYTKQIRDKISENNSGINNPFYGKKHTEQTKLKISQKCKERYEDPTRNPRYGYKFTEEERMSARKRMSEHSRPFYVRDKRYDSLKHASDELNLSKQTIRFRLNSNTFGDWKYCEKY